jgi:predicted enzyme related to lactoylglutathione lyase
VPITPMIVTADLARLQRFYSELFDAPVTERVPDDGPVFYLGLDVGGSTLGLVSDENAPDGHGRILLSIDVPDVDGLLERVVALGGTAPGPANDMPWGQRVAHVQDPDGNTVNLTQKL